LSTAEPPALETGTDPAHDGIAYPEWDTYRRRYRVAWCTVVEIVPPWEPFRPFVPKDPRALRPPLARLGLDLERRHRQLQGHDLDIDAAVEARTDTKACSAPDEAVYIDSLRRAHDLSALVLLDVSGSSAEPGTSGATVHDHQRSAAMALTLALSDLGDRVALYGFRSHGRASVQLLAVKRFNDPLDTRVLRRVGGLIPGGYTRLGAAIRHAGTVLERDGGTGRRLLVVLSDGRAYDHGYEGAYSEADCRRALSEVRRRGTGCLCLSVGASSDVQATARVFGTAAHATVPRPELLAGVVAPLFRSALQSAETMRRATQRTDRSRGRVRLDRAAP
jgi:nitric oxide reductase activation protein